MATARRERYLSESSALLQDSKVSVAQHLRLNLTLLQNVSGNVDRSAQSKSCPACGSLEVELWTVKCAQTTNDESRTSTTAAADLQPSGLVIHKCQKCSRSRKVPLREPVPTPASETRSSASHMPKNELNNAKEVDAKVQKASSKKRAKERKSRQGLQALMGKKDDNTKSSNAFDLMDFMSSRS